VVFPIRLADCCDFNKQLRILSHGYEAVRPRHDTRLSRSDGISWPSMPRSDPTNIATRSILMWIYQVPLRLKPLLILALRAPAWASFATGRVPTRLPRHGSIIDRLPHSARVRLANSR
jgi:hypothetical protein